MAKLAQAMGVDIAGLDDRTAAEECITATFDLLEDIGLPTSLKGCDIPKSDIPSVSSFVFDRAEHLYGLNDVSPRKVTSENIAEFFEKAFEGREAIEL